MNTVSLGLVLTYSLLIVPIVGTVVGLVLMLALRDFPVRMTEPRMRRGQVDGPGASVGRRHQPQHVGQQDRLLGRYGRQSEYRVQPSTRQKEAARVERRELLEDALG